MATSYYTPSTTPAYPPPNWYKYDFPLKEVPNAPVPSQADYSPKNVAWMIEFFAALINRPYNEVEFRYENNTPDNPNDDIFVRHPNDGNLYWPGHDVCSIGPSAANEHYEKFAKQSARLALFEKNSPAKIEYFQPMCGPNSEG